MMKKFLKNCLKTIKQYYSLLKTSWTLQTRVFFEDSTLHGVRYIAENGRPFIEKFMWFACVAIGTVTSVVIIVNLWEKFQTNPTITGLDTDFHNWDVQFPGLTVCQELPSNLTRIQDYLDEHAKSIPFSISSEEYVEFFLTLTKLNLKTIKELTNSPAYKSSDSHLITEKVDMKNLTFSLMNHCDEIFENCEWLSASVDCCELFYPVFTESGFCYTFNSRRYEKYVPWLNKPLPDFHVRYIFETDLKWALKFSVKNTDFPMAIYILHSDEEVGIDIQPHHIWEYHVNTISFSLKETYTTDDTRQLSRKQRHCTFPTEVKLKIDHIYTYTACTKQCRMDNAMKYCQCVPYFYDISNTNYYKHCKINQLKCIADKLEEIENIDHCNCQLGCFNTVYEVEKLSESGLTSSVENQFVSWPMIRYKREVLFGWVDLLVSFGGIAGLFLGFSLLSGVEIIYYFTIRSICMIIRERNELETIRNESKKKPLIDYDLSLIPYCIRKPYPGGGINEIIKSYYRSGNRKILINRHRVAPMRKGGRWKTTDTVLPPFGIEFIN